MSLKSGCDQSSKLCRPCYHGWEIADGFLHKRHKPRDLMRKKEDHHSEDNRPDKSRQEDCPPCPCPEDNLSAPRPFRRIRLFVRRRRLCWTFTNHTEQRTRMISFRLRWTELAPSPRVLVLCGSTPFAAIAARHIPQAIRPPVAGPSLQSTDARCRTCRVVRLSCRSAAVVQSLADTPAPSNRRRSTRHRPDRHRLRDPRRR